jgi:hypothetical protein
MGRIYTDWHKSVRLCLGKPSCYVFSNPFASELAQDSETPSLILLRKWPFDASPRILWEKTRGKHRVALGFQAGMCCEKASASPLVSVFSTTNPAFA